MVDFSSIFNVGRVHDDGRILTLTLTGICEYNVFTSMMTSYTRGQHHMAKRIKRRAAKTAAAKTMVKGTDVTGNSPDDGIVGRPTLPADTMDKATDVTVNSPDIDNGPVPAVPADGDRPAYHRAVDIGPWGGRGVADGQNDTLLKNADTVGVDGETIVGMRLDDVRLASLWTALWPKSSAGRDGYRPRTLAERHGTPPSHVRGARRDFNRGQHGNPGKPPVVPIPEFDRDGNVI